MRKNELPPADQRLVEMLAARQHERESAETRLLEQFTRGAGLVKQLWSAIGSMAVALVLGTGYVLGIKTDIERNARDIQQLRADAARNADRIENLRLEMKDKVDRVTK